MHEAWTDQLSEYLDGELPDEQRAAVEDHLRECAACNAVLNDLKRVVAQAQRIEARPPDADLWSGIAARLGEQAGEGGDGRSAGAASESSRVAEFVPRARRRVAFTLPQLAAAAALLMAVSAGVAWNVATRSPEGLRHSSTAKGVSPAASSVAQGFSPATSDVAQGFVPARSDVAQGFIPARSDGAQGFSPAGSVAGPESAVAQGFSPAGSVVPVGLADAQYDAAVADLEKALKEGRGRLDASTVAIVEHNLDIIDQAIEQARQALGTDPANSYLNGHLVEARRRKLDLLRRATALTETN